MVLRRLLGPTCSTLIALAIGAGLVAPAWAFDPSASVFNQAVLEGTSGHTTMERAVAQWYLAHRFVPLWTGPQDSARLQALLAAFDTAGDNGLPVSRYDARTFRARLAAARTEGDLGRLEIDLTNAYLSFADDLSAGVVIPSKVDDNIKRRPERPKPDLLLSAAAESTDFAGFLAHLAPQLPEYARLMKEKFRLEQLIATGGFGPRVPVSDLKPGDSGAAVVALRDRLIALGYLARSVTLLYDDQIRAAVVRFQDEHGINPDGVAGKTTLAAINTSPEDRLKSVIVAMERLRWMGNAPLGARHVWVNLPAYRAQLVDDGAVSFETRVIIGKVGRDTESPEFSNHIQYMDINPTWRVPRSIVVKEYLPQLQADPTVDPWLQITDDLGNVIPRYMIDFTAYDAQTFPFAMAQPPSASNALGLVKFMFPNPYNIYLHDTPAKSLFAFDTRAFSHGCIRLGDPFDFAYALLARQSPDPVRLFKSYLNTGLEDQLPLNEPVPVHLVYFTAWPDARGGMDYYADIYRRDREVFTALSAAGVTLGIPQGSPQNNLQAVGRTADGLKAAG